MRHNVGGYRHVNVRRGRPACLPILLRCLPHFAVLFAPIRRAVCPIRRDVCPIRHAVCPHSPRYAQYAALRCAGRTSLHRGRHAGLRTAPQRWYDYRPSGLPHWGRWGRCRQRPYDRHVMLQNALFGWSPPTAMSPFCPIVRISLTKPEKFFTFVYTES